MAMHYSILAWRIPWTKELDSPQFMDSQRVDMSVQLTHRQNLITFVVAEKLL